MSIFERFYQYFVGKEEPKKEEKPNYERVYRDLLRENLNTVSVDVFHYTDPLVGLNPSEKMEYLKYFHTIFTDKRIIKRLEYLINLQANMTLKNSLDGELDTAGVMKMDGLSTFKDDVERLSAMFLKEEADRSRPPVDPKDALRL